MPAAKPGEIWRVDPGMVAKVRPCLVLTHTPRNEELDVCTVVAHTTSLRGNKWEVPIVKSFLDKDGVFDVQRIATIATVKLERKLGELSTAEMDKILDRLADRLGI